MAEEPTKTSTTEPAAKPKAKKGPLLSFTGPEGATRIITLIAALIIILQGNNIFWAAVSSANALNIFCGVMLWIIGVIIIFMIGIIEISITYLEKIEVLEKYYRFEVLLILAALTILFESLTTLSSWPNISAQVYISVLLGGVLLVIAAILEIIKDKKSIKPSKFTCLVGCGYAILEALVLFLAMPITFPNYWDGVIALIVVVILLLAMFNKIKVVPYEWWMVLILGFILWGWVNPIGSVSGGGVGGSLVLISFILMLLEE